MTIMEISKCIHDEYCGGCIYQDLSYEEQLKLKQEQVCKLFVDKNIQCDNIESIVPSVDIYAYRNKMEYTFGDMVKDGEMTLGMHQKGKFMSIITVDRCQLVDEDFNIILKSVLEFCNERGYKHRNKKNHTGLLRNLIIRKGVRTGELLVNIVTTSQEKFDADGFVQMLLNLGDTGNSALQGSGCTLALEEDYEEGEKRLTNKIVGILHTINDGLADAVICDELRVLYGRDYYMERMLGLRFKVSAFSFFQTNPPAVERLYKDALDMIDNFEGKTVYDLFCGTGTISQALALKAKKVIGVEIVDEAVCSARENAEINRLENCSFFCGDVFEILENTEVEKPDVIVVDPPRVGIQKKALEKIISYGVEQILYISCNPKTLVENLEVLQEAGYTVIKTRIYDNFPFTKHVECVCLMSRAER